MWIAIEIPDDIIPKRQELIDVFIGFINGKPCECDYPCVVIEDPESYRRC